MEICFYFGCTVFVQILIVFGVAHVKWRELINPPIRYNSNEKRRLQDINPEKTRKMI